MAHDLSESSFDRWLEFTFAHPVSDPEWYWDLEWSYVGRHETLLRHCTTLFRFPSLLLERFTRPQLTQAMSFLPGPRGYIKGIADVAVPWSIREACVQSMFDLFEHLFSRDPLDGACLQWFNRVFTWGRSGDNRASGDPLLRAALVKAMGMVLSLRREECQRSALYGLGIVAMSYPGDVVTIIDEFIRDAHGNNDLTQFAYACRRGDVA
jgi:hypothetical protein